MAKAKESGSSRSDRNAKTLEQLRTQLDGAASVKDAAELKREAHAKRIRGLKVNDAVRLRNGLTGRVASPAVERNGVLVIWIDAGQGPIPATDVEST